MKHNTKSANGISARKKNNVKNELIGVRLTAPEAAAVEERARVEMRSLSAMARILLLKGMAVMDEKRA